ncbi:MAG: serine hydrolase [Gammaproteobacteria bacterium]|nr:serine hydrolase [Gammaproteobacteria bacterium]
MLLLLCVASMGVSADRGPGLKSEVALVIDQTTGADVYAKNTEKIRPIASITKLMTAMVVLDTHLSPDEYIQITDDDKDRLKYSRSRLPVGSRLTRDELLHSALVGSENRAAAALARTYPDGPEAFVAAMNRKAAELGMTETTFVDPTGLDPGNLSTARDVARLAMAAYAYPEIKRITTRARFEVASQGAAKTRTFRNTNLLVRKPRPAWPIGMSKTGFIKEAGRCLVMQATLRDRPMVLVFLNSWGSLTPIGDANRLRRWLERQPALQATTQAVTSDSSS